MAAGLLNLDIDQGATFVKTLALKNPDGSAMNLSGFTARMQIRRTVRDEAVLLELSTTNGRISLGGAEGTVVLNVDATTTAALAWTRGVYDLELVSGPTVQRIVQGTVTVNREVTR